MTGDGSLASSIVDRVLESRADDDPSVPGGETELDGLLRRVGGLVDDDEADLGTLGGATSAERAMLRLAVDRLRVALLDSTVEDPEEALRVLRRLEAIRAAATTRRDRGIASLSGVGALDLVVEVAHDLRSPLTSIMFLSETLRRGQSGPINDIQRQQLGIIYSAALGLHSVSNDLMELAREGRGREAAGMAREAFSLAALLESVHALVRPMLEEKGLTLGFALPRADVRVGQPLPLSRVMLNLLTNAIKFTEEGRIEVLVRERPGARVEFAVRDSGRGMDEKGLRTLYEMFRRGETETGYRFSETGLGLAIGRRMVQVMGGDLRVESEPGKGTRFWFEIELPTPGYAGLDSEQERTGDPGGGVEGEQSLE